MLWLFCSESTYKHIIKHKTNQHTKMKSPAPSLLQPGLWQEQVPTVSQTVKSISFWSQVKSISFSSEVIWSPDTTLIFPPLKQTPEMSFFPLFLYSLPHYLWDNCETGQTVWHEVYETFQILQIHSFKNLYVLLGISGI